MVFLIHISTYEQMDITRVLIYSIFEVVISHCIYIYIEYAKFDQIKKCHRGVFQDTFLPIISCLSGFIFNQYITFGRTKRRISQSQMDDVRRVSLKKEKKTTCAWVMRESEKETNIRKRNSRTERVCRSEYV